MFKWPYINGLNKIKGKKMENKILLLLGIIILTFAFIFPVSQEDIEKCISSTGWSAARCEVELSK